MKRLITSALALTAAFFVSNTASAQLQDGSIAPDFTATDINGNTHHLYDYLDQGYSVVMDISAAWCGPCWNYHTSGALEDLYTNHGPTGMSGVSGSTTNNVMVFFIEGEGSNTGAQITGTVANQNTSGFTQGNWTTGTPYPIIDNATIANNYAITYFPTIYLICPNRVVTLVGQQTAANLYAAAQTCPVATQPNDPAVLSYTGETSSCSAISIKANLQNMGTTNLTAATVKAYFDNTEIASYNWSGNLAKYGVQEITVGSFTPAQAGNLKVKVTSANDNTANDEVITPVSPAPVAATQTVTVKITTDRYGDETTWKLRKSNNQIIASGGPYTQQSAAGEYPQPDVSVTLPAGDCYTLEVIDGYGDGICCDYGNGEIKVVDGNNSTVASVTQFTTNQKKKFRFGTLGVEDEELVTGINVFPNPSTGSFSLNLNLVKKADVAITVTNAMGQLVYSESKQSIATGQHIYNLDLSAYANGMYMVNVIAGEKLYSQRVNIAK